MKNEKGLVFDIQSFSVYDGPGCRTLIFLKGCPLNCKWCSNPEGILPYPEIIYYKAKCINENHDCINACEYQALQVDAKNNSIIINRTKCKNCVEFGCIDACYNDAFKKCGIYMTIEELMKRIERDRDYWGSNGGITLGGGEAMYQSEFALAILKKCHESYIHTAIETCGYTKWEYLEKILPYTDWIFFDIKHMDPVIHKQGTGVSNDLILDNARRVVSTNNNRIIFRVTIVPKFNDSLKNINMTAKFIEDIGCKEVNILPYHNFGVSKYALVGKKHEYSDFVMPKAEQMQAIKEIFISYNLKCYIGNNTPF